ncbi:MAG: methionyl-tRNA formyltransferase [Oscillospiraceae bacterium]|nr:methionyl-tRNA formyltransferase [Oscillospiraceae bacterium]
MRIVFMGTPDFAVPSLKRLIADGHQVVAVYTQPDKPKNRGMKLTPPSVKVVAMEHDIPVLQPVKVREPQVLEQLAAFQPELIVVVAYGKILPREIFELPPMGCINVHSSLLPKYRGAAPINWAVINGDEETGVTIMDIAEALDAGDMIAKASTKIDPDESVETLHDRLAEMGAQLLSETVDAIANGSARRTPQNESEATYAPMLSRELSPIDWNKTARQIHDLVRGLTPWPATTMEVAGTSFKVFAVEETGADTEKAPGMLVGTDKKGILMACGDGKVLRVVEVQAPGKKRMKAADYLRGHPIQ